MRAQTTPESIGRHGAAPPGMRVAGRSPDPATPALPHASVQVPQNVSVHWAASEDDVREAQRLRYRVFVEEMGARIETPPGTPPGLDADRFDPYCDHLLVRAGGDAHAEQPGPVIGTYRVLGPAAALRAGGLYTDAEFDLTPIAPLRPRAVELGRSCVHPGWRSGGVIMALWSALAHYMARHELDTMIGCASIGTNDGGDAARQLWARLRTTHLAPACWRVVPRTPLPLESASPADNPTSPDMNMRAPGNLPVAFRSAGLRQPATPPLVKGYLRCGARVLGPPALDTAFNTADLPMMLRIADLAPRYRRHFLGK